MELNLLSQGLGTWWLRMWHLAQLLWGLCPPQDPEQLPHPSLQPFPAAAPRGRIPSPGSLLEVRGAFLGLQPCCGACLEAEVVCQVAQHCHDDEHQLVKRGSKGDKINVRV